MQKILSLLLLSLSLFACASPQYNYSPNAIDISEPPIGQINVANIGDVLVRQGVYSEREAVQVTSEFSVGVFGVYTFTPGYFVKVGEDRKSGFFTPEVGSEGGKVHKALLADPYQSMQVYKDSHKVCGVSIFGGKACENNAPIVKTVRAALTENSFQQSLIYSGRVGNKITIGYREFSNSTARPAFNNDVEYDLDESSVIGYKGARLEVLEATNQYIKYRVLQNFNTGQPAF